MNEFHPSDLTRGKAFHDSIRYKPNVSTERLDRAHAILTRALEEHGHESLTAKNFHEVLEHMHKDSRWHDLYSAGPELENALRTHLKIEEPNHAPTPSPSPKTVEDASEA
jgi:hypothetical protein